MCSDLCLLLLCCVVIIHPGCVCSCRSLTHGDWNFWWAIGTFGGLLEGNSMVTHWASGNKIGQYYGCEIIYNFLLH